MDGHMMSGYSEYEPMDQDETGKEGKKTLGKEAGRERGLRWRPQMLLLLAVRCQHEIETILKTLGQDSNLQPQQSETATEEKQFTTADM